MSENTINNVNGSEKPVRGSIEELEHRLIEANTEAKELAEQLEERRRTEAEELRDKAVELRNEAAALEAKAHELHPQEEAIRYEPDEPEVLREARANGGRLVASTAKSRKAAKRNGPGRPKRKIATIHQKRKASKKGRPGRPKGSKPQPPSQAEVVAIVKKGKGLTVAKIAERHGWDPRRVSLRLGAAARKGQVENRGEGRDGIWYAVA